MKRHLRHEHRYAVLTEPLSAAVRAELGQRAAMLRDTESPSHHLWFTSDHRALFAGGDQKRQPDRLRDKTLVQRTGELMYELTKLYPDISGAAASTMVFAPHPVDGVPYAGSHRTFLSSCRVWNVARPSPRISREWIILRHFSAAPKRRRALSFSHNLYALRPRRYSGVFACNRCRGTGSDSEGRAALRDRFGNPARVAQADPLTTGCSKANPRAGPSPAEDLSEHPKAP